MAQKRFLYLVADGGSSLSQIFSGIESGSNIDIYYDDTITNVPNTSEVFRYVVPLKDEKEMLVSPKTFLNYVRSLYSVDLSTVVFYVDKERHKKFSEELENLMVFDLQTEHGLGNNVLLYVFDSHQTI